MPEQHDSPAAIPVALRDQVLHILMRMTVLSDADSCSVVEVTASHNAERQTIGPPGTVVDTDRILVTLAEFWAARFASVTHEGRLRSLIRIAERDLRARTKSKPSFLDADGNHEDAAERDRRLLDWYQGIPADEAAEIESESGWYCSPSAMRKVRRVNDHDPHTGLPVEPMESAIRACVRLRNDGLSQRKIASELGIGLGTVNKRLQAADDQTRRLAA